MAHPCNPSAGEAGAGGSRGQSHSSSRLSQRQYLKTELGDNENTTPGVHIHTQNCKHTHTCTRGCGGHGLHTHTHTYTWSCGGAQAAHPQS
ncbi:hypothetical protein ACRRTK_010468 [Alexandromys fortis]